MPIGTSADVGAKGFDGEIINP